MEPIHSSQLNELMMGNNSTGGTNEAVLVLAVQLAVMMCKFFMVMPCSISVPNLLKLAKTLTRREPRAGTSFILERLDTALKIIFEVLNKNETSATSSSSSSKSGSRPHLDGEIFDNLVGRFWSGQEEALKDLGITAPACVKKDGGWVLDLFFKDFDQLMAIRGSPLPAAADIAEILLSEKRQKVYDSLLESLRTFYEAPGFGRTKSERMVVKPEVEKKICEVWGMTTLAEGIVSAQTQTKWEEQIAISAALDVERTRVNEDEADRVTAVIWFLDYVNLCLFLKII